MRASEINFNTFLATLPGKVKLVAVSKTKPVEDILAVYNAGHKIFGENRVQELVAKYDKLPLDIEWHLIGHLQSNKVRYIAQFVYMIQSVDSLKLLVTINQEAIKANRVIEILFQVYIAQEETKFGLNKQELTDILKSPEFISLENIKVRGLMGIASFTEDMNQVRTEFRNLKNIFNAIKLEYFAEKDYFSELSMGMSGDYKIAIEEGATIIRLGSLLFGERNYV